VTNLAYLGLAVVISLVGCLILWLRHRKPRSMQAHMQRFARELEALAPDRRWERRRNGAGGRPATRRSERGRNR